jgi:hypothetical protein
MWIAHRCCKLLSGLMLELLAENSAEIQPHRDNSMPDSFTAICTDFTGVSAVFDSALL